MTQFWLYDRMSRRRALSYRGKIMLTAFVGTHVPLLALIAYLVVRSAADWRSALPILLVVLAATLVGAVLTLLAITQLLRPVLATARTLRGYRVARSTGALPTGYRDEAGTLMADTAATLAQLEMLLDRQDHVDAPTGLPDRPRLALDIADRLAAGRRLQLAAWRFEGLGQRADDPAAAARAPGALAQRLTGALAGAPLYRVADDGFVALIERPPGHAGPVSQMRLAAIDAALSGAPAYGVGVTIAPDDGRDAERLIDQAMAAAIRGASEGRIEFHSAEARDAAHARSTLAADLRRAFAGDELTLYYQPLIDLKSGRTIGAEALLRWQHPARGLVDPSLFMPLAEEMGQSEAIDRWALGAACGQLAQWRERGLGDLTLTMAVSAARFRDPDLAERIGEALRVADLASAALEIALPEPVVMADLALSGRQFGRLRDAGIGTAIADFGTAGIAYVRSLPLDRLRIAREFVAGVHLDAGNQAMCETVIALARGLGLHLIADGVASAEEVRFLVGHGQTLFQGSVFSPPLTAEAFAASIGVLDRAAIAARPQDGGEGRAARH